MAASWYVNKFNPFHLPTVEQAAKMGSFSEPLPSKLFDDLTIVLCPASFPLFFLTMDLGATTNYIMWAVIALINGPIYYCVGLIFVALSSLWKSN